MLLADHPPAPRRPEWRGRSPHPTHCSVERDAALRLQFDRYDVSGLFSIAHLLPRSKGRTGVYVLGFSDGERYVGQAVDAVSRFATHRRRWSDIVSFDFCRVPPGGLDQVERDTIAEYQRRGHVRNIAFAR